MTSPRALRLLLIAWVSLRRSLSFAAPLDESLSDPAKSYTPSFRQHQGEKGKEKERTTRFKQPSHASPVIRFVPFTRNVKTECDREERSFIQVVATARRDCACWRSEATWLGPVSGTVYYINKVCNGAKKRYAPVTTPVTVVRPLLSCLISCLRLSSSPVPSRSLIVSLYCHRGGDSQLDA